MSECRSNEFVTWSYLYYFMRNIIYFNVFTSYLFPSTIYRDNFFQGKSYEIKQDALRDECGSVPRLLFLRRDSFKFFLEDKEDFHLRSAKPSSTVKGVLGPDLEQRRFSPRVEPRKLPYSVYSASAATRKIFCDFGQQTESSVIPLPDKRIQPEQPEPT